MVLVSVKTSGKEMGEHEGPIRYNRRGKSLPLSNPEQKLDTRTKRSFKEMSMKPVSAHHYREQERITACPCIG